MSASQATPTPLEINLIERVNVGDIVTRAAELYPARAAIVDGDRSTDYATLDAQVNRLGSALLGLGLAHQDVVAVMARNCAEMLVAYFACARAGLICAPVNLGLRPAEIAWCLNDAKAKVLIVEEALGEAVAEVLAQPVPSIAHRFRIGLRNTGGALARSATGPMRAALAWKSGVCRVEVFGWVFGGVEVPFFWGADGEGQRQAKRPSLLPAPPQQRRAYAVQAAPSHSPCSRASCQTACGRPRWPPQRAPTRWPARGRDPVARGTAASLPACSTRASCRIAGWRG